MDENMVRLKDEFITARVSYHGANETEAVNAAYMELRNRMERLRGTLSESQVLLLRDCENAYRLADGETGRFYYKAGFGDAIRFLLDWGEESE